MTKDIEREALIAEIELFIAEAMKAYVVERWAESYTNTDPFGYVILENENNKVWWMKAQAHQLWQFWQAAKAHEAKKLEGCVVVPVQCPDPDFADSLFDELSKKAIGEFGDDLLIHFSDIDEEKIWALMVEAARGVK